MQTSFPELRDRTRSLIDRLESVGVPVPKNSRLRRYLSELDRASGEQYIVPADPVLRRRHRLLAEVDDLEVIAASLSRPPAVAGWKELVSDALNGRFLWTHDADFERARSIQFELIIAALIRASGYEVRLTKTDIVATVGAVELGIEAKRPRSAKKVQKNLKKAAQQLLDAGRSGLIAVDATIVVNEEDKHLRLVDRVRAHEALANHATNVAKHMASGVAVRFGTEHVCGLLLRASFPTWQPDDRILGYIQRWPLIALVPSGDPRRAVIEDLFTALKVPLEHGG